MEEIVLAFRRNDLKSLREMRKYYREALKYLNENGFCDYIFAYSFPVYISGFEAQVQLNLKIKACSEYINALQKMRSAYNLMKNRREEKWI